MIIDYNTRPMDGINSANYEALHDRLCEQLTERFRAEDALSPDDDAYDMAPGWAGDALTNEWLPGLTARGWLIAAGARLNVDVSDGTDRAVRPGPGCAGPCAPGHQGRCRRLFGGRRHQHIR